MTDDEPAGQDTADRTTPDRTTANRTTADRTTADRTTANRTTANRTTADRTTANRTTADRTTADRTTANRTTANRTTADRTTAGRVTDDEASTDPDTAAQALAGRASTDRGSSGHGDDAFDRRLEAVVAGHRGDGEAAAQFLADEDAAVRSAALGALARCGELSAPQVRSALGDEAAEVRRRAVELAPPDVDLIRMLNDRDASVVEATAAALGERDWDPAPVSELCRVAGAHDDPLCRESAIAALGAIAAGLGQVVAETESAHGAEADAVHDDARARSLDTLLAAMGDRPQIRRRALLGLHQFDDDRAVEAVHASLEDRDRQVRAVAGELLGVPVR